MTSRLKEEDKMNLALSRDSMSRSEWSMRLKEKLTFALQSKGGLGKITPLGIPKTVADNPHKFLLQNPQAKPIAVLFCSRPSAPHFVARSVDRTHEAKKLLGSRAGRVVLEPLLTGVMDGLSYAVFPWRQPLTDSRFFWTIQRARLRPVFFRWLREATAATLHSRIETETVGNFERQLIHVAQDPSLGVKVRACAKLAIKRLHRGLWKPRHVLTHNDLWKGNLLMGTSSALSYPRGNQFVIIDWSGANPDGYGIFDFLRLAQSMQLPVSQFVRELRFHCHTLECELGDAKGHLLAALGHLGTHLEHFSRERYRLLADKTFHYLSATLKRIS